MRYFISLTSPAVCSIQSLLSGLPDGPFDIRIRYSDLRSRHVSKAQHSVIVISSLVTDVGRLTGMKMVILFSCIFRIWRITSLASRMGRFNPLPILCLIPVVDRGVYPWLRRLGYEPTRLRKIGTGFILAGLAMLVAAWVEIVRRGNVEYGEGSVLSPCHRLEGCFTFSTWLSTLM